MTDNEWIFRVAGGGVHRLNKEKSEASTCCVHGRILGSPLCSWRAILIKDFSMERSTKELPSHHRGERSLVGGLFRTQPMRIVPIVRNLVEFRVMQKMRERGSVESKIGSLQARMHRAINYPERDWDRLRQPRRSEERIDSERRRGEEVHARRQKVMVR